MSGGPPLELALLVLSSWEAARGNFAVARTGVEESLALGYLVVLQSRVIEGATALGASEAFRERLGLRRWPIAAAQAAHLEKLVDALEEPVALEAHRAGRGLTPEAALELVRQVAQSNAADRHKKVVGLVTLPHLSHPNLGHPQPARNSTLSRFSHYAGLLSRPR